MACVGPQRHRKKKNIYIYVTGFSRFSILVLLPAGGSELLKHVGYGTVIVYTFDMCWELHNKNTSYCTQSTSKHFVQAVPLSSPI